MKEWGYHKNGGTATLCSYFSVKSYRSCQTGGGNTMKMICKTAKLFHQVSRRLDCVTKQGQEEWQEDRIPTHNHLEAPCLCPPSI